SKEDRSFNEKKTIFSRFCVDFFPSANKIAGIISQVRGFLYEVIIPISPAKISTCSHSKTFFSTHGHLDINS
ncbi:MAG: hypothetical protein Q8P67_27245, partial [archaeon]|nr:hypothetical protein [archaeon]